MQIEQVWKFPVFFRDGNIDSGAVVMMEIPVSGDSGFLTAQSIGYGIGISVGKIKVSDAGSKYRNGYGLFEF